LNLEPGTFPKIQFRPKIVEIQNENKISSGIPESIQIYTTDYQKIIFFRTKSHFLSIRIQWKNVDVPSMKPILWVSWVKEKMSRANIIEYEIDPFSQLINSAHVHCTHSQFLLSMNEVNIKSWFHNFKKKSIFWTN
jgi:hypothetical protein